MIKRYEKPFINDLTTEYSAFADGSTCITGGHFLTTCAGGLFASEPCSAGYLYNVNECFAGPSNLPTS